MLTPADGYVSAFIRDIDRGRVLPVRAAIRAGGLPAGSDALPRVEGSRKLVDVLPLACRGPVLVTAADGTPEGVVEAADIAALISQPQEG